MPKNRDSHRVLIQNACFLIFILSVLILAGCDSSGHQSSYIISHTKEENTDSM